MKLSLNNISINFGSQKILQNVTLEANAGNIIAIIGQNGAGKTTLFELLSGTIKPNTGSILLSCKKTSSNWQTTCIGRLFQNTLLGCAPNLTVRENIILSTLKNRTALPISALKNHDLLYDQISKEAGYDINQLLNKKMGTLSGGERQLLSFLLLAINKPTILLLDEPTAALDPIASTTLLKKTISWVKKQSVITFIITHDLKLAQTISSHIWLIERAKIEVYETQTIGTKLEKRIQPIAYDQINRTY